MTPEVPPVPGPGDTVALPPLAPEALALTPEMVAGLPNPEEIMAMAKAEAEAARIRAHNLGVEMARDEKLARRRAKRTQRGRPTQGDINAMKKRPGLNRGKPRVRSA